MPTGSLRAPDPASWALVTGATSGIGAAYARELARLGYSLVLTGRRLEELAAVAREIEGAGGRVETCRVELSDPDEVEGLIESCHGRRIDVLVNNAGFGIGTPFLATAVERELAMELVHDTVPLRLAHALLPGMVSRGGGLMINVSSLASFFPLPGSTTYSATKAFLRVFTESLAMELRGTGVRCQVLCPGLTRTHFHAGVSLPAGIPPRESGLWMTPEAVVRVSLRALRRGTVVCVPGAWNRVLRRLGSWVPRRLYYRLLSRIR